jgi:galactokinase
MTGAGFGGCAVALVSRGSLEAFTSAVAARYRDPQGYPPELVTVRASDGAGPVQPPWR